MPENTENKTIRALCNPVRLKLLKCISTNDKTVGELISNCGLAQSAVSQHLIKLKKAGLVKDAKVGREVYYSITNSNIIKICDLVLNLTERN